MSTLTKRIEFQEWLPDMRQMEAPSIFAATNIWPAPQGYSPVINPSTTTDITAGTSTIPLDACPAYKSNGDKFLFVGSQDKLHRVSVTATVDDVTGTAYSAGTPKAGGRWDFVQWGDDIIGSNWVDPIQRIAPVSATAFAVLSSATATPKCRTLASSRNFLIAGYTHDATDGTSPQRVQWCAINDPTDWVVSAVTQADTHDLLGPGGPVQRVFGGEYAVVFQENAVHRMSYVGTPAIWQFDEVVSQRGLLTPGAAAQKGDMIFYLSQDGFEVLVNGSESQPIGANKVNNWFFENLDWSKKEAIRCAADPATKRVFWYFPDNTNSNARNDLCLIYDYSIGKWGTMAVLGNPFPAAFANDLYGEGVLDVTWNRQTPLEKTVIEYRDNTAASAGSFASVQTGPISLVAGRCAMVKAIKVGFAQPSAGGFPKTQVTVERLLKGGLLSFVGTTDGETTVEQLNNRYNIRSNGWQHRFKVAWAANLTDHWRGAELSFIDIEYVPTHSR